MSGSRAYDNNPTQGNPQVSQAQVVLNGDFDNYVVKFFIANSSRPTSEGLPIPDHLRHGSAPDNHNLMPREMAMMVRPEFDTKLQRQKSGMNNLRDMRVFSSANHMACLTDVTEILKGPTHRGMNDSQKRIEMQKCRELYRSQLSFVGVPLTKVLFDENLRVVGNNKVPIQISGSTTIWNTGPYDIHPGDTILWDVPWGFDNIHNVRNPPGLPTDKRCFWTVPLREALRGNGPGDDVTSSSLVDALLLQNPGDISLQIRREALKTDDSFAQLVENISNCGTVVNATPVLKNLLYLWNVEWSNYTSRVVGRALKGASPGMAFDIMLQRAM